MRPLRNSPAPRSHPAVEWFEIWPLRLTAASTWLAAVWTKSESWTPILNSPDKKNCRHDPARQRMYRKLLLQLAQQFAPDFLTPAVPFDSVNAGVTLTTY